MPFNKQATTRWNQVCFGAIFWIKSRNILNVSSGVRQVRACRGDNKQARDASEDQPSTRESDSQNKASD